VAGDFSASHFIRMGEAEPIFHFMKPTKPRFHPGFTLVELLVVIAMIAVLVSISAAMVFRFRNTGDKVAATNNLRQLQVANIGYAADHSGKFVPPSDILESGTYEWFENPEFISQIKGSSATYKSGGEIDTTLDKSLMDPAVVRTNPAGNLANSFGYTIPDGEDPVRQAQLDDSARSAAFITADAAFADFASQANIADRHANKAIVVFYDGHASPLSITEIQAKPETDIFWSPVPAAPATPTP
jgi:prepilin-type N-terminal cleavage/methylation domain-containing protein/prepilin-type processing-associated H-X9-DG protein